MMHPIYANIINTHIQHRCDDTHKIYLNEKEVLCVALNGTCSFVDGSEIALNEETWLQIMRQISNYVKERMKL